MIQSNLDLLSKLLFEFQKENKGYPPKCFLAGVKAKRKMDEEFQQIIYIPKGQPSLLLSAFRGIPVLEVLPPYPDDRIEAI